MHSFPEHHAISQTRRRVGVFDSGLGGLTVVRALARHLPYLDIIYIADTIHAPYGEKSHDQIRLYSADIAKYLIKKHKVDALVVACNTATSAAISYLREMFDDTIIVGTEPGIKPAMRATKSRKVGILATPATLAGDKYQELADKLYSGTDIELFEQACPGLVAQIESGRVDSAETRHMLEGWLKPMREADVDTIVLGCTHYPLASRVISEVMGKEIKLIETGEAIASRLGDLLGMGSIATDNGNLLMYATGEIRDSIASMIIGKPISVKHLDL